MVNVVVGAVILLNLYVNSLTTSEQGSIVVNDIEHRINHNTNISLVIQKQNQELLQDIKEILTTHLDLEKILNKTSH